MKTIKPASLSFIIFILALVFGSCKKQSSHPAPLPTGTSSSNTMQILLQNLATPAQTFAAATNAPASLSCVNGTGLTIPLHSFLTSTGVSPNGTIDIRIKELLTKKEMILNNAYTESNGQLLISGGELFISASHNSQPLQLAPSAGLYITCPSSSPGYAVSEFYGNAPEDLSATDLNWLQASASASVNNFEVPPMQTIHEFVADSLGWISPACFFPGSTVKTTCSVNLVGGFNSSNTIVFLAKNRATAVTRLRVQGNTISSTFYSFNNSIPVGYDYTAGAIGFDGINYYYASQQVTMSPNMVINLPSMVQTSKSQIEINLAGLP